MKPQKLRVALLVGGPSLEHENSLQSGNLVYSNLDTAKYEVIPLRISRSGDWPIDPEHLKDIADVAFIAMHGAYGADGTLQDTLRELGVAHTSSDHLASALAHNRVLSGRAFKSFGLRVPNFDVVNHYDLENLTLSEDRLPVLVGPAERVSAGTSLIRTLDDLHTALDKAFVHSKRAVIQDFVPGRELIGSVMDDGLGHIFPLPVTEHITSTGEHITPANLSERITGMVQASGVRAHEAVGASGLTAVKMILGEDGDIYVLEVDAIPHLREGSPVIKAALNHGLEPAALIDRLIESALIRHHVRQV